MAESPNIIKNISVIPTPTDIRPGNKTDISRITVDPIPYPRNNHKTRTVSSPRKLIHHSPRKIADFTENKSSYNSPKYPTINSPYYTNLGGIPLTPKAESPQVFSMRPLSPRDAVPSMDFDMDGDSINIPINIPSNFISKYDNNSPSPDTRSHNSTPTIKSKFSINGGRIVDIYDDVDDEPKKPVRTRKIIKRRKKRRVKQPTPQTRPYYNPPLPTNRRPRPDYDSMNEEELETYRSDLRIKFGIIKKDYPYLEIPKFDNDTSLHVIHSSYEKYLEQIYIDKESAQYKIYLIIAFLGIEFFITKILKLNGTGFTKRQIKVMMRYEQLLRELGERSTGGIGSEWPVEVRLIFLTLFQALIFVVVSMISKYLPVGTDGIQDAIDKFVLGGGNNYIEHDGNTGTGIPVPPPTEMTDNIGNMDIGSLIGMASNFFGAGNNASNVAQDKQPEASKQEEPITDGSARRNRKNKVRYED